MIIGPEQLERNEKENKSFVYSRRRCCVCSPPEEVASRHFYDFFPSLFWRNIRFLPSEK